jgi:hypothetical protein
VRCRSFFREANASILWEENVTRTRHGQNLDLSTLLLIAALSSPVHAALIPGDVVVANFFSGLVKYDANLTNPQTLENSGDYTGVSVMPGGGLVASWRDSAPATVDQGGKVDLYGTNGTYVRTLTFGYAPARPYGSCVAADNTLWISDPQGSLKNISHFSESGTLLGSFTPAAAPVEVVSDPLDGTLWMTTGVASTASKGVYHYTTSGTLLSNFSITADFIRGIAFGSDGNLLVATFSNTSGFPSTWYRYDRLGTELASGSLGSAPQTMAVVTPEPSSTMLLAIGALALAARRRAG